MSHQVLIALGSNSRPTVFMAWAAGRLTALLSDVRFSRIIWTKDVKGGGRLYMNRLAYGTTDLTALELQQALKAMEAETGRSRELVTLDLDLMQYDQERHHLNDWPRPYIQQLLPDLT